MAQLRSLSGQAFDLKFLESMIPHHASGLPSAKRTEPHLTLPELQEMRRNILEGQARQIGQMQWMRARLGGTVGTEPELLGR